RRWSKIRPCKHICDARWQRREEMPMHITALLGCRQSAIPTRSSEGPESNMTEIPAYTPPDVWVWEKEGGPNWRYGATNRPIAGATHEKELPRGKHPLQLYSQGTPNGVKVTIMLEELLAAGHSGAE